MRDRLREAFDSVRAEPELKDHTRSFLAQKTRGYRTRPASPGRRLIPAMACLFCLLVGLGGAKLYFTPTSVISVDINPSLELGVNRFDRVISVEGRNEDGEALAQVLDLRFLDCSQAISTLLSDPTVAGYLAEDEVLSLSVVGSDPDQTQELLATLEHCTAGRRNTYCCAVPMEEVSQAHSHGLSYGKYRLFLQAQALDPTLTPQDVQGMTVRELQDWISAHSSGADPLWPDVESGTGGNLSGAGQGHDGNHEHGHGHSYGQSGSN